MMGQHGTRPLLMLGRDYTAFELRSTVPRGLRMRFIVSFGIHITSSILSRVFINNARTPNGYTRQGHSAENDIMIVVLGKRT